MGTETPQTTAFPGATSVGPEGSPEAQAEALAQLGAGVGQAAAEEAQQALGEPLDYQKLRDDPESLGDAIERLSKAWDGTWDRFAAIFAPLGKKPSEIAAAVEAVQEPGKATEEKYKEWEERNIETEARKKAEHAEVALAANPSWRDFITASCSRHKDETGASLPISTVIAFIEMESSFNPNARPIDPKTKIPLSTAKGFGQAIYSSADEYRKFVKPGANMENPQTGIDFTVWYMTHAIKQVNQLIAAGKPEDGYKSEYRLSAKSDTKNLYLAYHDGPTGYLVLRRYLDNPSQENKDRLMPYQKDEAGKKNLNYASYVEAVAKAHEALTSGVEQYASFDFPPLENYRFTSGYGGRGKVHEDHPEGIHFHNGVDYAAPLGTRVQAVRPGKVTTLKGDWKKGQEESQPSGNFVVVEHADGSTSHYAHLSKVNVKAGQQVVAGAELGKVGSTGRSTGPHLHFTYKGKDGITRNPENAVAQAASRQRSAAA